MWLLCSFESRSQYSVAIAEDMSYDFARSRLAETLRSTHAYSRHDLLQLWCLAVLASYERCRKVLMCRVAILSHYIVRYMFTSDIHARYEAV